MKKTKFELTEEQKAELDALLLMTDDEIDTSDIPEIPVDRSKPVRRGMFYRPVKLEVPLALDDFLICWFRENSAHKLGMYEYINNVLLDHIRQRSNRLRREHRARAVREAKARGKITAEKAAKLEAEMAEEALPSYEHVSASEMSEVIDWYKAAVGFSFGPDKQEVLLVLDDYVIEWLRENSEDAQGFCEEINWALWKYIRHYLTRKRQEAGQGANL